MTMDKNVTPAVEKTPQTAEEWYRQGITEFQQQEFAKAGQCFDQALLLDVDYVPAISGKGNVLATFEHYEQAAACFQKVLELDSSYVEAWNGLANVNFAARDMDKALQCFDKAVELDEGYGLAWYGKGSVHMQKKELEAALTAFDKVLAMDEKFVPALNGKGGIYLEQGKKKEALDCYHKVLEVDNNNSLAWFNRGSLLFDFEQFAESRASLTRAYLVTNPGDFRQFAVPFLRNFLERFHAPALLYRVLWEDFPQLLGDSEIRPLAQKVFDSYHELGEIAVYLQGPLCHLEETEKRELAAIIRLYHGDPLYAAEIIGEIAEENSANLHLQYLLLLSLDGFMEKREEYEEKVYQYLMEQKWEEQNPIQIYYAAQLWLRKGEVDQALRLFELCWKQTGQEMLPALYMAIYCYHLLENEKESSRLLWEVLGCEKKLLEEKKQGFLREVGPLEITLGEDGWEQPFYVYKQRIEISGAVLFVQSRLKEKKMVDELQKKDPHFDYSVFMNSNLQQTVGQWWQLAAKSQDFLQKNRTMLRDEKIQNLQDELKDSPIREALDGSESKLEEEIVKLTEGKIPEDPSLLKDVHYLTQIAYFKGELPVQENILLQLHALYVYYRETMEADGKTNKTTVFENGLQAGIQNFVGALGGILIPAGLSPYHTFLNYSQIGGVSQTFFEGFFSEAEPVVPQNYQELKATYCAFVQKKKEQMGADFYQAYPIFEFSAVPGQQLEAQLEQAQDDQARTAILIEVMKREPQISEVYEHCAEKFYEIAEELPLEILQSLLPTIREINPVFAEELAEDFIEG
ncbi:MAG: hypothetical protein COB67_09920 [SAR324 cluster bacterium]|uniref:Uncharacterized protein n=1 Tax=SAR324 cluster bacterium TaxID=2024889 RepID=A0A2A4SZA7_9DELT|nr:MAG: hypothetical protein COB67_09920 [SAR324 cluster bacterium]